MILFWSCHLSLECVCVLFFDVPSFALSSVVMTFLWTPCIWFHSMLVLVSMTSTTWILLATMDLHSPGGTDFLTPIPSLTNITQIIKLWKATDWQRFHSHTDASSPSIFYLSWTLVWDLVGLMFLHCLPLHTLTVNYLKLDWMDSNQCQLLTAMCLWKGKTPLHKHH